MTRTFVIAIANIIAHRRGVTMSFMIESDTGNEFTDPQWIIDLKHVHSYM